jgi:DNA-binding CsgD family transcriptional regulator/DNA-binding MarR family transcriptional regulator
MFEPLGLSANAVGAYRALLASPGLTTQDLAARLSLDVTETTSLLLLLEEKGFLRRSHSNPANLRTESPQLAFERLLGEKERELHRSQETLSSVRAGAAELIADLHRSSPGSNYGEFERLVGTDEIVSRLRELGRDAAISVDSLITTPPVQHVVDQARTDEGPMLARGVRIRNIYPAAARHDMAVVDYAEWLRANGGEARTAIDIPNRVIIYDGDVAVLMSDPDDFWQGAVVLNTPGAVIALHALFEVLWSAGEDLAQRGASANGLRPEERELLQLLSRGLKDEAISRSLGISIRTVRRMINVLSNRVDATSRFELGARAVERGWL